jgi:hypothetical protein
MKGSLRIILAAGIAALLFSSLVRAAENKKDDLAFLEKWKDKLPENIVHGGKPWSL